VFSIALNIPTPPPPPRAENVNVREGEIPIVIYEGYWKAWSCGSSHTGGRQCEIVTIGQELIFGVL
jgi:hypothetical protein